MRRLLRFVVAWCALLLLKSPVRESHMFIPSGYNSFAFGPIRSQVQLKPASQQASPGIGRSSIAGSRTRLFFCAANLFLKPNIVTIASVSKKPPRNMADDTIPNGSVAQQMPNKKRIRGKQSSHLGILPLVRHDRDEGSKLDSNVA